MTAAGFTMSDAYIWQGGHGKRLPENNRPYGKVGIAKIVRRVLTRAGLEQVTRPHGLRATGAKLLIEAGASLELVSQHLGHAHVRTTEDYYVGRVSTAGLAQFDGAFG
jgi:integrase